MIKKKCYITHLKNITLYPILYIGRDHNDSWNYIIILGCFYNPDNALTLAIRQHNIIQLQEKREIKYYVLIMHNNLMRKKHFYLKNIVLWFFFILKYLKISIWLLAHLRGPEREWGKTITLPLSTITPLAENKLTFIV